MPKVIIKKSEFCDAPIFSFVIDRGKTNGNNGVTEISQQELRRWRRIMDEYRDLQNTLATFFGYDEDDLPDHYSTIY